MPSDLDETMKQLPIEKFPLETSEVEISFQKLFMILHLLAGAP